MKWAHMSTPIPALDYATRSTLRRRFSWLICMSSACILAFVAFLLIAVVPTIRGVFMDFKMELPAPTMLLLLVADWFSRRGWMVTILLPPLLGFLGPRFVRPLDLSDINAQARLLHRMMAAVIVMISMMVVILLVLVIVLAPFIKLVEGFSAVPAK